MPDAISAAGAAPPPSASAVGGAANAPSVVASDSPTVDPELLEPANAFDKDMFLQLLVAQLKYQNPLSPMDGNELMAQTAQLTTVEKLTELTDALDASLANDQLGTATGFIGREVTYTGPDAQTHTDTVTGVRFTPTGPVLILGDTEVAMGSVEQVTAGQAALGDG